uniref:Lipase-like C-terminal domain-containing protein n=1 Tax=Salix viminalis TaxID=40686 RepID=A0A6N2K137_SALVM
MIRWWVSALKLTELFVSTVVHSLYGFYIFSTALTGDLSQALNECFSKPNVNVVVKVETSETTSSSTTKTTSVDDLPPIVLVHGIFGFGKGRLGGLSYFAGAEKKDERVLVPDLGSLTSTYDRARELFYYLKGGQVDYGEEHSMAYGHSQFGRFYKQGQRLRNMKPICLLQFCRLGTIIYDWFDIHWLKAYYNFGFDHFNMSWKKMGIFGLIDCLLGNTGPFASGDWILPDLTIQGSMQLNCHLQTFPDTYYFSYATKCTKRIFGITVPSGIIGIHPFIFIRVLQMSQWRHSPDVFPPYKGYRDEDWQDNDGALNTISMTHLVFQSNIQAILLDMIRSANPCSQEYGDHVLFIMNRDRAGVQFDMIYVYFERCRKYAYRQTLPNEIHQ